MIGNPQYQQVNELWYTGEAWGKFYALAQLQSDSPPRSIMGKKSALALADWARSPTAETAAQLTTLTVDMLLPLHMPESSSYAGINRGEWVEATASEVIKITDALVKSKGCINGQTAGEEFKAFVVREATICLRLIPISRIIAVAAVSQQLCAIFFYSDT